jgi:uncharacterized iron-regulated membrane protein
MNNARRLWLQVHRWVGLTAGLVLVVVGLSGSFLAFYPEIDRLLNPDWLTVQPVGQPLSMQQVIDAAQAAMPERFLHSVFPAKHDTDVHHVWFTPSAQDQSAMWEALVNPYTGQTLGQRAAVPTMEFTRRNLANTIYTLHFQLFMGDMGATIVGFCGVFLLVSSVSGVVLWWPRNRAYKKALFVKRGSHGIRLHYDIHRVSGIYSVLLLGVLALTGIYLTFPSEIKPAVNWVSTLQKQPQSDALSPNAAPAISADDALNFADQFAPGHRVKCLWMPGASGPAWRISMTAEQGVAWNGGPVELWLHPNGGAVVAGHRYAEAGSGDTVLAWQLPLHSGKAFGLVGRAVVFVLGFVPLIMAITGLAIWIRKRKAKDFHEKAGALNSVKHKQP